MTYRAPISDMLLALNHGAGLQAAVQAGHYGDFDGDITAAVLEEAGKFAGDVLARLGYANAFGASPDRYPRTTGEEIRASGAAGGVRPQRGKHDLAQAAADADQSVSDVGQGLPILPCYTRPADRRPSLPRFRRPTTMTPSHATP